LPSRISPIMDVPEYYVMITTHVRERRADPLKEPRPQGRGAFPQ
jgi:hypothetical protein